MAVDFTIARLIAISGTGSAGSVGRALGWQLGTKYGAGVVWLMALNPHSSVARSIARRDPSDSPLFISHSSSYGIRCWRVNSLARSANSRSDPSREKLVAPLASMSEV
jgi:hypothetical protein